jgi:hypothetical protein
MIVFLCLFFCAINANAQAAVGPYVSLKTGLYGSLYFPHVTFSTMDNENFSFDLILVGSKDYYNVPADGKLLVKFEDNSIIKLFHNDLAQVKDYDNTIIQNSLSHFYYTIDGYKIEDLENFLSKKITKIRVELFNQTFEDIEIKSSYQEKFHEKLLNAFYETKRIYNEKASIRDDFEQGF